MQATVESILFLSIAFGYSFALFPLLRSVPKYRILTPILVLLVSAMPLIVDSHRIGIRAAACVVTVELLLKMLDFSRCCRLRIGPGKSFVDYAAFLLPFPVMAVSFERKIRTRMLRRRTAAISAGIAIVWLLVFIGAIVLVESVSRVEFIRASFALDHISKVAIFVVAIESLSRLLLEIERLAGFQTTPLMRHILLSKSIGDFWCRYNTRVHQWFVDNLFSPISRTRFSIQGVFLVFFASAVLHEVAFAIATSHVNGYQFAFFMIQAPAICVMQLGSKTLNRRSRVWGGLFRLITVIWMWSTSVLFFHGVNQVFPFIYVSQQWLR